MSKSLITRLSFALLMSLCLAAALPALAEDAVQAPPSTAELAAAIFQEAEAVEVQPALAIGIEDPVLLSRGPCWKCGSWCCDICAPTGGWCNTFLPPSAGCFCY